MREKISVMSNKSILLIILLVSLTISVAAYQFAPSAQFILLITVILAVGAWVGFTLINIKQHVSGKLQSRENELNQSNQKYKAALERIGDALILSNIDGKIDFMNRMAEILTGWEFKDAAGKNLEEIYKVKNDSSESITHSQIFGVSEEERINKETNVKILISGSGSEIPIRYSENLMYNGANQIIGKMITFHDETEMKIQHKILSKSEEKYRSLVESSRDAIFVNYDNRFVYMNKAGMKLFGAERMEDIIGKSVFDFFLPEFHDEIKSRIEKVKTGSAVPLAEQKFNNLKGEVFFVEVYSLPFKYKNEPALQCVLRDISDRKRAEEKFDSSLRQLHNLTEHLNNIREEERTRISRELHDELGQLITVIRIDLNNILKNLPSNRFESLKKSLRSTIGLADTMLKDISKIASELRPGVLDRLGLIPAMEWQIDEFLRKSNIECKVSFSPPELAINKNSSNQIFRIFQELLTNILRHSTATKVSVSFEKNDNDLKLEVVDNGKGISEEEINSTKSLGLIGIRERVHSLNGKLEINGEPDRQTKIIVTVPFLEA